MKTYDFDDRGKCGPTSAAGTIFPKEIFLNVRQHLQGLGSRAWRFYAVGAGNAIINFGTLNLLLWLLPAHGSLLPALYNVVALTLAHTNSYLCNSRWTFRDRAKGDIRQKGLFVFQAVFCASLNAVLFWLILDGILAYATLSAVVAGNLAKLAATAVTYTMSFFLLRHLVFASSGGGHGDSAAAEVASRQAADYSPKDRKRG